MAIRTYKCQLRLIDGNTDPLYEEGSIYFRHPKKIHLQKLLVCGTGRD